MLSILAALIIVGLQTWSTWESTRQAERILSQLESLQAQQLSNEKARQEVLSLRIENERKKFFWNSLLAGLGPMMTAFVALLGAWLGLRNYLDAREKERLDRAAGDFDGISEHLGSDQPLERAVGIAGLQHFFTPDKQDFHLRVLSVLVTASRLEASPEVLPDIRIAAERAVKNLPEEVLVQISWQRAKLQRVNFAGHKLRGIDLRDADLENADLTGCDLSGALLINARLNGAKLDRSCLRGANLTYVDLAGASLTGADLQGAVLNHSKIWHMDLKGADLRGAKFDSEQVSWELINNWRHAIYEERLRERLFSRYGPEPGGPKALMLMWEIPPLVAGGTWTACYHLVRNLRQQGANITVVVPWDEASILPSPFGTEVEVVSLGIVPPRHGASPYSPVGGQSDWWSPYASARPQADWWSSYGSTRSAPFSPYYGGWTPYADSFSGYAAARDQQDERGIRAGSVVLRLTDEFRKRLLRLARERSFDVIHAHDWVTFSAAGAVAGEGKKPWVAHFHSTERERRPLDPDVIIQRIERQGVGSANHIVVPSAATSRQLGNLYGVPASRITVVPNALSLGTIPPSEMGSFEAQRAIFLGRLTHQKGPDLFLRIAAEVRRRRADAAFWIFGTGEELPRLRSLLYQLGQQSNVTFRGMVEWRSRGTAFSGAGAVVVPSRSEPFGMVVLEAMQHRVPVLYPAGAGVAEVINSGVRINPEDIVGTAAQLERLLTEWTYWEGMVEEQSQEIADYPGRGYERRVSELWQQLHSTARSG